MDRRTFTGRAGPSSRIFAWDQTVQTMIGDLYGLATTDLAAVGYGEALESDTA